MRCTLDPPSTLHDLQRPSRRSWIQPVADQPFEPEEALMRRAPLVILAALAAACVLPGSAAGQEPRAAEGQDEVPPVLSLLGQRERLSLTSEQIAALDSIAHEWDVENERLTVRGTMISSGLGGTSISRVRTVNPSRKEAAANNLKAA